LNEAYSNMSEFSSVELCKSKVKMDHDLYKRDEEKAIAKYMAEKRNLFATTGLRFRLRLLQNLQPMNIPRLKVCKLISFLLSYNQNGVY
jgi:hypothetical protein